MGVAEKLRDEKLEALKNKLFGLWRGIVINVNDPKNLGRIRAQVHELFGEKDETNWASYCSPFGGGGAGFFFLPEVGDSIWIAFEAGDINRPVWLGFWFNQVDAKPADAAPRKRVLQTRSGHKVIFDDGGKTIRIEDSGAQSIEWNAQDGEITITANVKVIVEAPIIELGAGAIAGVVTSLTPQVICPGLGNPIPIAVSTKVKAV